MNNQVKAPLYQALKQYSHSKKTFHMPGHKLGTFGDLKTINLFEMDVTEANGLDNLYEAEGIIKEALDEMSRFYGSKETLMLTNGSTAGILASLLTICKPEEQILVARNCHHSVWHALVLSGAIPIYINPTYNPITGIMLDLPYEEVKKALEIYPDVKGAIIVSPTYEGVTSDVEAISELLHRKGKYLIVDEAHGAHFEVSKVFPMSAVRLGADLVIQSMHKTLPTLTQSALVHMSGRVDKEKFVKNLRMVQTSSPSYAMMGLMDYMRAYIEEHRADIEKEYIEALIDCRNILGKLRYIKLFEGVPVAEIAGVDRQISYDRGKIVLLTQEAGISGYTLAEKLEEDFDIMCEAAMPNGVILMTTFADQKETLGDLVRAVQSIDQMIEGKEQENNKVYKEIDGTMLYPTKQAVKCTYSPRTIYYSKEKKRLLKECEGYLSKENIMLYPPGIPIVCIGEMITYEHIVYIEKWKEKIKGIYFHEDEIICKVVETPIK